SEGGITIVIGKEISSIPVRRSLLVHLFRLFQEIKKGYYPNTATLARLLEVSHRTVDRYLEVLRDDFGAPIEFDRKRGGYYFREKWSFPFPEFTEGEVLSLFLLAKFIKQFEKTPLERPLRNLRKKLEQFFPTPLKMTPRELEMMISPSISVLRSQVEVGKTFETIFLAIQKRRRIQITYTSRSSEETREREVEPYHLYNFEGIWYLCGFCFLRQEIRDFALDRIGKVVILPEGFTLPASFNPEEYLTSAFRMFRGETCRMVIRFDAYQARWIRERVWHPTQKLQELPDKGVLFEVEANPQEIKRWVLGYGSHAEILEPPFLREEVKKEIEKMHARYFRDSY
ncbi:MAG: helix-turn-helix transcriptional regulator, partial [Candidatus Caldatribacteriaceae bacterium]